MIDQTINSLAAELGKRGPFASPEQEAHLNLAKTASILGSAFDRMFDAHGLSGSSYNILRILRGAKEAGVVYGKPCHVIGEQMVARVPDVTRLVDRLEKAGLVERHRCTKDRRVVYVAITAAGMELLARLDAPTVELHRAQLGHMTAEELHELSRLLTLARSGPGRGAPECTPGCDPDDDAAGGPDMRGCRDQEPGEPNGVSSIH